MGHSTSDASDEHSSSPSPNTSRNDPRICTVRRGESRCGILTNVLLITIYIRGRGNEYQITIVKQLNALRYGIRRERRPQNQKQITRLRLFRQFRQILLIHAFLVKDDIGLHYTSTGTVAHSPRFVVLLQQRGVGGTPTWRWNAMRYWQRMQWPCRRTP